MQYVMVDRKLCGIFGFSCMFAKRPILLLFAFSFASCLEKTAENENRNGKSRILPFCPKTSLFVANKVLIFSGL